MLKISTRKNDERTIIIIITSKYLINYLIIIKKYSFIVLQVDTISHETSSDITHQERHITSVVSYKKHKT